MSIAVTISDSNGNRLNTRQFARGQSIVVSGHVTGALGLGEPFTHIQVEIPEISFLWQDTTSLFGNFSFGLTMPNRNTNLTLRITATYTVAGQDNVVIPIGVGDVAAEPLPAPPVQGEWPAWVLPVAAVVIAAIVLPPLLSSSSSRSLSFGR